MNAPDRLLFLPDIQSQADGRDLAIDEVGVAGIRYPVSVRIRGRSVPTVGTWTMTVGLPAGTRGTHMSRFIELLEEQTSSLDVFEFKALLRGMLDRLGARSGALEMRFPYFATKAAPVSGVRSRLDYEVTWTAESSGQRRNTFRMAVTVPVTSLCPCSKEISSYGAHNQRSHIRISARLAGDVEVDELIAVAEASASCEVFSLLKRPDEKFVTERAYDNPMFVEDLVRDVAASLMADPRIADFVVEAENFESIHNHSAFARLAHQGGSEAVAA